MQDAPFWRNPLWRVRLLCGPFPKVKMQKTQFPYNGVFFVKKRGGCLKFKGNCDIVKENKTERVVGYGAKYPFPQK